VFLEDLRKVVGIIEPDRRSDLPYRKGRPVKQLLGPVDPQLQVVRIRPLAIAQQLSFPADNANHQ
jgi:hypothetical protein